MPKKPNETFTKKEVDIIVQKVTDSIIAVMNEEIRIRDHVIRALEFTLDEATKKPSRGRPRKKTSFTSILLGAFKEKKGPGAPTKHHDAVDRLQEWDSWRTELAGLKRKDYVGDKELAEHSCSKDKGTPEYRKRESVKKIVAHIKRLREKTGIRSKRRPLSRKPLKK